MMVVMGRSSAAEAAASAALISAGMRRDSGSPWRSDRGIRVDPYCSVLTWQHIACRVSSRQPKAATMSAAMRHHPDCEWHHDHSPCTCGLTEPRPAGSDIHPFTADQWDAWVASLHLPGDYS